MPKFFISDVIANVGNFSYSSANRFSIEFIGGPFENGDLLFTAGRNLRFYITCENVSMPGQGISTAEAKIHGPIKKMPYTKNYTNTFEATFRVGEDMFERLVFESWHNNIINKRSNKVKYYDDYTAVAIIRIYDQEDREIFNSVVTGVYPETIGDISLDHSSKEMIRQSITFAFHETLAFGDPKNTFEIIQNNIFSGLINPSTITRIVEDGRLSFGALEPIKSLSAIFNGNSPIAFEPGSQSRIDVVSSLTNILTGQRRGRLEEIE